MSIMSQDADRSSLPDSSALMWIQMKTLSVTLNAPRHRNVQERHAPMGLKSLELFVPANSGSTSHRNQCQHHTAGGAAGRGEDIISALFNSSVNIMPLKSRLHL